MKLTEQETQLVYQLLRVSNAALSKHKIELIRTIYQRHQNVDEHADSAELAATFDFHEQIWQLLQKVEKIVEKSDKKSINKKPRNGNRERRT
jgi:hypothetical protein